MRKFRAPIIAAAIALGAFFLGASLHVPAQAAAQDFILVGVGYTAATASTPSLIDATKLASDLNYYGKQGYHVSGVAGGANNVVILEK